MLILNAPTTNQKNKKRERETKYGSTHPLENPFQQTLQRHFFNWSENISQQATSFIKYSTGIQLKQLQLHEQYAKNHQGT